MIKDSDIEMISAAQTCDNPGHLKSLLNAPDPNQPPSCPDPHSLICFFEEIAELKSLPYLKTLHIAWIRGANFPLLDSECIYG